MCTCSNQLQPHDPVPGICARVRLADIESEIAQTGTTSVSLRERLDLFYDATGTAAEDFEPEYELGGEA